MWPFPSDRSIRRNATKEDFDLMQVPLLYGRDGITVTLPDEVDVTVIRKPTMPMVADPASAVRDALASPVAAPDGASTTLSELAKNASSACIAICDITRPVPNHLFLRPLIEALVRGGIAKQRITVLIATGLHRPNLGDELAELVGDPWVLEHVAVVNHDALDDANHVDLGRTSSRGTPVKIDRRFVEADLRIATGLVEPHFMAGFSGGRKVIAPGLAHNETIRTFHNHAFMSDAAATNCNLHRNPLHEEQLEIVKMLGGAFAVNTVIDEHRNLSMINFGEILSSHDAAVQFVRGYCRVPVPRRFPVVITSAAGYPLDKTYYQTVKGMVGALDILEPGGDLVIASECSEGLGSAAYAAAQQKLVRAGADGFLDLIRDQPLAEIDHWQTQMQTKAMYAGRVHLYSSLPPAQQQLTGVTNINDFDRDIGELLGQRECDAVAVIPEGPYVIPYVESSLVAR